MADNITIFNRAGAQVIQNLLGGITMNESHSAKNTVTSQTLENGSPLVDHIVIEADELSISLLFTNMDGHQRPLEGEVAKTAWQELKRLRNNRELLEIVTLHEIYTDMVIVSIDAKHDAPYKGQLNIDVSLKKIDVTNPNIGANNLSNFKKITNTRNIFAVGTSAVAPAKLGRKDPVKAPAPVAKKVTQKWYEKTWAKTKDVYQQGSAGYSKAIEVKNNTVNNLMKVANFIQMAKNYPTVLQSQIEGKLMEFVTEYNGLEGGWTLSVSDIEDGWTLSGLRMVPGVNLFEGYLLDSPIDNLYVVELVDGASETPGAWGDDGVQESDSAVQPPAVLVYFTELPVEEAVAKEPAFSLGELDYTIVTPPDISTDLIFLDGAGPILKFAGQDYRLSVISGAIALEGPLSPTRTGTQDDFVFLEELGPVLKHGANDYRIVMTGEGVIGVEGPLGVVRAGTSADLVFVDGAGPVIKFGSDNYRIIVTAEGVLGVEGPLA